MPRVKNLVELNEFLSKLVDLLASSKAEIAVSRTFRGGALDFVGKSHEGELEVAIEEGG